MEEYTVRKTLSHIPFAAAGALLAFLSLAKKALAHEAYVIPDKDFWGTLASAPSPNAIEALQNPHNLNIALSVFWGIVALILLNFLFRFTSLGQAVHRAVERLSPLGPFFVRAAIAASFFYSARTMSFLGPELPIASMPFAETLRWGLYVSGTLIAVGLFTELAALIGLIMFTVSLFTFGSYMATYLNYAGELIVLLLFGMRRWSIDSWFLGPLKRFISWEKYETTIVRIGYGLALIYAAVAVKLTHPSLTESVVTRWNLTQFHWLFPSDPLLIALGAGLAELAIGIFILVGFEMRMTVLISLFYITLSLLYFKELVWPHLMLYGISLNLLVQPEVFTIDHMLFRHHRLFKKWWRRPLSPHTKKGKSELRGAKLLAN